MPIVVLEKYVVKPERIGDFSEFAKKYLLWREKRSLDLYREVKKHVMINQCPDGQKKGPNGGFLEIWEYENLADCDRCWNRVLKDKEIMTQVYPEFARFIAPLSHKLEILDTEKNRSS